jgi:YHS domain-containing protein
MLLFRSLPTPAAALLAAIVIASPASGQSQAPSSVEALDGVDPVLLVQGKEVQGKPGLKVVRGRFEYLFSSAETKVAFEKEPARYEIQMNGLCARMGKATGGSPSDFLVYDGKVYIFGSDECHKRFAADPKKYLAPPAVPLPASARANADGRAAIERAVKAIGGAGPLDRITTYMETASVVQKRPTGDVPITVKTMWRFPAAVRLERVGTVQGRTMSSATLMTPAGIWFLYQGRACPGNEAGRPSMQLDYGRQIVPLLHARGERTFKAASLGRATIGGMTVDLVRVTSGGVDVTLGLDPATSRIHSISFLDRNAEGEVGEYLVLYSDFRAVDGLMLPFAERALFRGVPDDALTRTLDAIAINPPLESTLFEPGTAGGQ